MFEVDLHAHSLFSLCGLHTIVEMRTAGRARGLQAMAITDHGPAIGGRINTVFFERLRDPVPGIRLLKGMECNLVEPAGAIDFPRAMLPYADVILLGIHPNTRKGAGAEAYTAMLTAAMERNPWVDVITHLNDTSYPVDHRAIAAAARRLGMVIEINNSKTALQRVEPAVTEDLVEACRETGCRVAVNSDAHALNEIGDVEAAWSVLQRAAFPEEQIVNLQAERAYAFLDERRAVKRAAATGTA